MSRSLFMKKVSVRQEYSAVRRNLDETISIVGPIRCDRESTFNTSSVHAIQPTWVLKSPATTTIFAEHRHLGNRSNSRQNVFSVSGEPLSASAQVDTTNKERCFSQLLLKSTEPSNKTAPKRPLAEILSNSTHALLAYSERSQREPIPRTLDTASAHTLMGTCLRVPEAQHTSIKPVSRALANSLVALFG